MSKIDDVAKAIEGIYQVNEDNGELANPEEVARAAIEAMREPTAKMVIDGTFQYPSGGLHVLTGEAGQKGDPTPVWQAMLEAALIEDFASCEHEFIDRKNEIIGPVKICQKCHTVKQT